VKVAACVLLASILSGCSAEGDVAPLAAGTVRSESGSYTLEVKPMAVIQRGENTLRASSLLPSGTRIDRVSAFMPAHGHGASSADVRTEGSSIVISRLMLTMPGKWQIEIELSGGGGGANQTDLARFSIEVP
jgi:hypothetical protein